MLLDNSGLSNSGHAIYKEVNLSLKFSNKNTSEILTSRKVDTQVEEPKIMPSNRSNNAPENP